MARRRPMILGLLAFYLVTTWGMITYLRRPRPAAQPRAARACPGRPVMKYITGFFAFWWDFIVGDAWEVAAGVLVILVVVFLLVQYTRLGPGGAVRRAAHPLGIIAVAEPQPLGAGPQTIGTNAMPIVALSFYRLAGDGPLAVVGAGGLHRSAPASRSRQPRLPTSVTVPPGTPPVHRSPAPTTSGSARDRRTDAADCPPAPTAPSSSAIPHFQGRRGGDGVGGALVAQLRPRRTDLFTERPGRVRVIVGGQLQVTGGAGRARCQPPVAKGA